MKRFYQLYGVALNKKKLQEIISMLMALEAIFAFSYLGYIDFPAVSTTTLHVLVIVAAMILGAEGSVPVVCVFSLTSMWIASYATSSFDRLFSPFASGMPVRSLTLLLARVLFALLSSWLFSLYFHRPHRHIYLGIAAIAMLSTFLHGAIILGAYLLFFPMFSQELTAKVFSLPMFRDWLSYVSAALVCCGVHAALSKQPVRHVLSSLCEDPHPTPSKGYQRAFFYAKIGAGTIVVLCVLYLRKQIFSELQFRGITLTPASHLSITVFLLQLLFAFACLFGITTIIIRWINEFYTTQQRRMSEALTEQSVKISIDALTGVFSRFAYHDAIEAYTAHIPEDLAAFLIDINGLKAVNDTLGHEAGDELICGAARCITKAFGKSGRTFRIGGDEFVVFGTMSGAQAADALEKLDRIVGAWSGTKVRHLSVSAGCALARDFAGHSVEELVREADKAMYQQKEAYYQQS